jgi:hypothetical protein
MTIVTSYLSRTLWAEHSSIFSIEESRYAIRPSSPKARRSILDGLFFQLTRGQDVRLSTPPSPGLATLFVVPAENPPSISEVWLQSRITKYKQSDDVFRLEFLESVIFVCEGNFEIDISPSAKNFLETLGSKRIHFLAKDSYSDSELKPGPHAIVGKHLREVWRLYSDTHGTLLTALKPDTER